MLSLEKFNAGLAELEKQVDNLTIADVRQLVAASMSSAATSSAAPVAGNCEAMTKGKDPKQCSKKATVKGSDGKCYCPQHLRINCPGDAPPAAASSSSSTVKAAAASKKASPKTTTGKGPLATPCSYKIGGKNPRQCTAASKHTGPDGQCYCGTHFKKFEKEGSGAGVKANNSNAEAKIASALTQPVPVMNDELGLAVDQNGICYLNDYEGSGVCVCGSLVGGVVVDVTAQIEQFADGFGLPTISAEAREKVRKMSPSERLQFMALPQSE
jgi:hypothetical protein